MRTFSTKCTSHVVHSVEFLPVNGKQEMLSRYIHEPLKIKENMPPDSTGIYHYGIQVVPTVHTYLNKTTSESNQYSFTERAVEAQNVMFGVTLGGQQFRDDFGIAFTYDFYPVKLVIEETSESFLFFMTNLCAVVGGTITILGLFDGFVHRTSKAVMGKKD